MGVKAGVLTHVSASEIKAFLSCARLWFRQYVEGIRTPPTKAQKHGTDVALELERHFKEGAPLGLASKAVPYLPPRDPSHAVEAWFEYEVSGVPVKMRPDLVNVTGSVIDRNGVAVQDPPDSVEIIDWKTGNPDYALPVDQFATDIQLALYGDAVGQQNEAEWVRLSHVFIPRDTDTPAFKRTRLVPADTLRTFVSGTVAPVVERIKEAVSVARWQDAAPTLSACGAYGGCAFRKECGT